MGPVIGAVLVNFGKSVFTTAFPEMWLFVLGALFVAVTLFLPKGIVGTFRSLMTSRQSAKASAGNDATVQAKLQTTPAE